MVACCRANAARHHKQFYSSTVKVSRAKVITIGPSAVLSSLVTECWEKLGKKWLIEKSLVTLENRKDFYGRRFKIIYR